MCRKFICISIAVLSAFVQQAAADEITYRLTGIVSNIGSSGNPHPFVIGDAVVIDFTIDRSATPIINTDLPTCERHFYAVQDGAVGDVQVTVGEISVGSGPTDFAGSLEIRDDCVQPGLAADAFNLGYGFNPRRVIATDTSLGNLVVEAAFFNIEDSSGMMMNSFLVPDDPPDTSLATRFDGQILIIWTSGSSQTTRLIISGVSLTRPAGPVIEDIVEQIIELNIENNISNAYDAKLDSALTALDDNNEKNDGSAVNSMHAFINSVEAQRGKKLTDAQADELIASAQMAIDLLTQ